MRVKWAVLLRGRRLGEERLCMAEASSLVLAMVLMVKFAHLVVYVVMEMGTGLESANIPCSPHHGGDGLSCMSCRNPWVLVADDTGADNNFDEFGTEMGEAVVGSGALVLYFRVIRRIVRLFAGMGIYFLFVRP